MHLPAHGGEWDVGNFFLKYGDVPEVVYVTVVYSNTKIEHCVRSYYLVLPMCFK